MVSIYNQTVEPLRKTERGCTCHHTTLPPFCYAVDNKTDTKNGYNYGFTYNFDYGNGYTATVTESLTPDFCFESTCKDVPMRYTDPDGEIAWFAPVIIKAIVFGIGNTIIHNNKGDVKNFGDGLKYFATGAVVGTTAGATWGVGLAAIAPSSTWAQAGDRAIMGGKAANVISTGTSLISNAENAGKILMGKSYVDDGWRGLWQGVSRYSRERLQTWAGYNYTQFRNTGGNVDRVDYFGGVTYATKENASRENGVSIGNYININIRDDITGDFDDYVLTHPMYMHEYGHTIDSRAWGPLYLFSIGIPSIISAGKHDGEHYRFWTERRANRRAEKYFRRHFNITWNYPDYPLH